jgi:fibrillarin-like pre-rRNA processing protein
MKQKKQFLRIQPHKLYQIYTRSSKNRTDLLTKNLVPGQTVYDEALVTDKGVQYRTWDPSRSKLAAGILKGLDQTGIKKGSTVLYLGASSGTTISHISDMVETEGIIYGIDISSFMLRDLVLLSKTRPNIIPLLGNASKPQEYASLVTAADVIYQDIAQPDQTRIFLKNCDQFLRRGGFGIYCVKSRSIDITKKPKQIYAQVRSELEKQLTVIDFRILDPYEKDHCIFFVKKK